MDFSPVRVDADGRTSTAANASTLYLHSAKTRDDGKYWCKVYNSANTLGSASEKIMLEVLKRPTLDSSYPKDQVYFPGQKATLSCIPEKISWPATAVWEKRTALNSSVIVTEIVASEPIDAFTLIIQGVDESDEAEYGCTVCNAVGCTSSRLGALRVLSSPQVVSQTPDADLPTMAVAPKASATISVTAEGLEPLSFQWRYADGTPVDTSDGSIQYSPTERCAGVRSGSECSLIFLSPSFSDEESYYCFVSNTLGNASSALVSLEVATPPVIDAASWPSKLRTECNDPKTSFEHQVVFSSGSPPFQVSVYFSKNQLDVFRGAPAQTFQVMSRTFSFEILSPTIDSEGYYAFGVKNLAIEGEMRSTVAQVTFNQPPLAVASVLGHVGKEIVVVTLPSSFVDLTAALSGDLDDAIVGYEWEMISSPVGDVSSNIRQPLAVSTRLENLTTTGIYEVQLSVRTSDGCVATDTVSIAVNSVPVAVAEPILVSLPGHGILVGANSFDMDDGDSVESYKWRYYGVASGVVIENDEAKATNVTFDAPGKYAFVLEVMDTRGAMATTIVHAWVYDLAIHVADVFSSSCGYQSSILMPATSADELYIGSKDVSKMLSWTLDGPQGENDADATVIIKDTTGEMQVVLAHGPLHSFSTHCGVNSTDYGISAPASFPEVPSSTLLYEVRISFAQGYLIQAKTLRVVHVLVSHWSVGRLQTQCSVQTQHGQRLRSQQGCSAFFL